MTNIITTKILTAVLFVTYTHTHLVVYYCVIFSPQDGKVCYYYYYCKPCCVSYGTEHSLPLENSLAVFHGSWKPSQTPITVCLCQHLETTSAPLAVWILVWVR